MTSLKASISAVALLALAAGGIGAATLMPVSLYAQTDQGAAGAQAQPDQHARHHADPVRMTEGRIAFIKAVLQITSAQENDFTKLADAMRANAKERADAFAKFRQDHAKPMNAVDRLEARKNFSEMRAAQADRVLIAFKPLYDNLSSDQKQVADNMMGPHHRGFGRHH
jgi:hypothetical protein